MKNQLHSILSKYPFIHIDKVGELTILVPLTGARTVTADFTANSEKATALYLFGDNTCKSDLERTEFFKPTSTATNPKRSFDQLYADLIKELRALMHHQTVKNDATVIQTLIDSLEEQKKDADKFQGKNPNTDKMRDDLCNGNQGFAVKGEFIVSMDPDGVRNLNLPNVLNLTTAGEEKQKLLPESFARDREISTSLNTIPKITYVDPFVSYVREQVREDLDKCRQGLTQNPAQLFRTIYNALKDKHYPKLTEKDSGFFDTLADNLKIIYGDEEDYKDYTEKEVVDAIQLILKQTGFFAPQEQAKYFSNIFHQALTEFEGKNGSSSNKIPTYKLFSLQTFLYLCALQLRLKNPEHAKKFLSELQQPATAKQLIKQLCSNEAEFIKMLQKTYGVTSQEYHALVNAAFEIITDHVDVPHFDELKVACSTKVLENTHYLVIGGRLCWSTSEITESGTINSAEQKRREFDANFEKFFEHKEAYLDRKGHIQLLQELLNGQAELEEAALQSLEYNAKTFSFSQKRQLLELAINKRKYKCAEFLVNQGVHDAKLFQLAFNQSPVNMQLVSSFTRANSNYMMHYATTEQLAKAIREGRLEFIKIILALAPNLLETRLDYGTPLMVACREGRADIVNYFMSVGANVLETTGSANTTAKSYAAQRNDRTLNRLFTDYHLRVREQLREGNSFPLLSTPGYFLTAIKQGEHQLVEVLLEYFPELKNEITLQVLIDAIRDRSLAMVQALLVLKPELLNQADSLGKTPLFYACEFNNEPIAQHLIAAGADLFKADNQGKLPRNATIDQRVRGLFIPYYTRLAPESEQYQAIFTSDNYRIAILTNDHSLAECIAQAKPEFVNEITPEDLLRAIQCESLNAVKYILNHRADLLEYKDSRNKTPFFHACEKGNLSIAHYLMMAGANVYAGEITAFQSSPTSYSGYTIRRAKDLNDRPDIKELLNTYPNRLHAIPAKQLTTGHIVDAIDARDLTFVNYFLNKDPKLKQGLSEIDLQRIEQQRIQEKLSHHFKQLIQGLDSKRNQFPYSRRADSPYQVMYNLSDHLMAAGSKFFNTHVSMSTVQQFESECNEALRRANPVLSSHRGWFGFPLWIRAIAGIIAAATLIPAITVQATTEKGYFGTFFKTPATNTAMHMEKFSAEVEVIKTELIGII
ncbi:ankyrin repeat domain-containing protein [Legionella saoudiensis]|uniref:ankyrin repeat domain-containing protein n=1 Tax=Legionella saoudiensis TaxID=1750561 RepID=UPI00072FECF0|nr:ankyrin repeat domain-containing protein [Legionella saoudiensis]